MMRGAHHGPSLARMWMCGCAEKSVGVRTEERKKRTKQ